MTDKELKKALKGLPSGTVKNVSERINLNKSTVCNVLKGKVNSPRKAEILQATAEYLTEYKAKEREASEALRMAIEA